MLGMHCKKTDKILRKDGEISKPGRSDFVNRKNLKIVKASLPT